MNPSKKELLKMPVRDWDDTSRKYSQILLVPSGRKHDSGYMHIAVIGVYEEEGKPKYEIAAFPDDISCIFPVKDYGTFNFPLVRMDCYYPSGVLRYHARNGKFTVSEALSSVEITFTEEKSNSL